jgi:DNA repair protein RadC
MKDQATMPRINSETSPAYLEAPAGPGDDAIIEQAMAILKHRMVTKGIEISSPQASAKFLQLKLAEREREVFAVLLLDTKHRMLCFEELFYGTIDGASIHPREVVKAALQHNAAPCIRANNHPSGCAEPSQADIQITKKLKDALALIDVRVLDHIIVTSDETVSLAQQGEL